MPELAVCQFTVNGQSSYTSKYDTLADNSSDTQWLGNVGYPGLFRVSSNLGLNWEKGDYSVSYMARYFSGMKEECTTDARKPCSDPGHIAQSGAADPLNRVGSNTFHDLQFSVKLPWNATASLGANNITDHMGPQMYSQPNSSFA